MPKIAGIVLARMDSRRFPGKALTPVGGIPLLERCFSGVLRSRSFSPILATTARSIDQPLADLAESLGIPCFRGDLDDVYLRVCECLKCYEVDIFARINGDSPFVQTELLESGLDLLQRENCEFVTNLVPRRFPYGVSVEILRSELFVRCAKLVKKLQHKEHITSYFYENLDCIKYAPIVEETDLSGVRLTIDTRKDLDFIEQMLVTEPALFDQPILNIVELYQKTFFSL